MAFEPKIEHFMQELSYEESNLLGNNREETFWYLDEAHLSVVVQEFDQLSEEKQHMRVSIRWVHKIHAKALDDVEKILEKRQQSASEFT